MAKENVVKLPDTDEKIWQQIRQQTENIQYGTVTITIHDGRITQLEASSKTRF
jgi:hypothetical protein